MRHERSLTDSTTGAGLTRRDLLIRAGYFAGGTILLGPVLQACGGGTTNKKPEKKDNKPEIDMLNSGKWNIPGVVPEADGLRVASIDYAIRSQDGSKYIENPAVNLFGTHLKTQGDFEIAADLQDIDGEAAITLYGSPPIVFDELRYKTPSVRLALEGDSLWVGVMNVDRQDYGDGHNFQVSPSKDAQLSISKVGSELVIKLNGQKVGRVPAGGTFDQGEVWLGLDSSRDQNGWLLSSMSIQGVNGGKVETVDSSSINVSKDSNGLDILAKRKRPNFSIGTALASSPLVSDRRYAEL